MKKNVLIKGILVLVIIALLTIGFAGCGIIFSTTGTVYITVDTRDDYDIYLDGVYQGYTNWSSYYTLYNVPIGYHTFEALGYYHGYYGIVTNRYIYSGANNVTIITY